MSDEQKQIELMSFEEALKELEKIVRELESGDVALDKAISSYERGAKLKDYCSSKLNDAKSRVEKISIDSNGSVAKQPLDD